MRHKTTLPRRAAAFLLALLLAMPVVYADTGAGTQKLQTTSTIVDGLTYRNTVSVNTSSRVESFALELAPDSPARPILMQSAGTIYGAATINKAVSNAQAAGYHVLGAINTDFFSMSTGVPIGIVIEDGVYKSCNSAENAMAIVNDSISILPVPQVALSLSNQTTGYSVIPHAFNKYRTSTGGIYLFNKYFSTVSTRSTGSGWYVRMKALPDPYTGQVPELTVNSTLTLEVTELLLSDQAITIGPDEYILSSAENSGWNEPYENFQVGDLVTLTTACSDPTLSAAQWAGGVGDIMVQNGELTDSSKWVYAKDGRQPRTAMGIKPDGTVILYAVDGRQSGYSIGLSQLNLAEELRNQGCTTVVNLDGGGSTSLSLWVPGTAGPAVQNKPSGGSLRSCATFLLLVTDDQGSRTPQRLAPKEDGQVVLLGSSVTLPQATAVDERLNPVSADLWDLSYTSLSGNGAIQNGAYTAVHTGTDTVLLTAEETGLSGTTQVHVVDALTEFKVTQSGSSTALTSLSVKPGQQVQLAASGSYWGRTALRDFAPVTVSVQGGVGTVDRNGLFTASDDLSKGGSITFSAGGLSQTVQVASSYVHNDVQPGHWAYDAVEYCYEHGVCSGISSTLFGPDNSMIRGDFMLMLYNAAGRPAASTPSTFTDVAETDYYYTALSWAQAKGLASGSGGNLDPRGTLTRAQMASLLARVLEHTPIQTTPSTPTTPTDPVTPEQPVQPGNYAIALDQSQVTLASGSSVTLNAVILPAVENASITWASSSPDTAFVSPSGMVTNLNAGSGTATVTITASWNGASASCSVTCQPARLTGTVTGAENGLNVRSEPSTSSTAIGGLRNGTRIIILSEQPGWYQILFRTVENKVVIGYVSADYVVKNQ